MKRTALIALAVAVTLVTAGWLATLSPAVDVWLYRRAAQSVMNAPDPALAEPGGLSVLLAGTGSPLPDRSRAGPSTLIAAGDDYGSAGERPVDPTLLDHLAWRFAREHGWSLKKLMREIVLSATYRQSSRFTDELRERDPQNRLFARASRFRLPAEMLRDQTLAASGLLSAKMYGRSVMPPQPEGQWQVVYNIQRWTELPRGGHFAALEEPEALAADLRAFFHDRRA